MNLLLLAVLTAATPAAELTVQPGDDVATLTASLSAGDVVTFSDGTYELTGTLYWSGQGTESQPIVLQAAQGAEPVLQLADGGWIAQLDDASHVTIRGLGFRGGPNWTEEGTAGLRLGGDLVTTVTVDGCTFSQLGGTPLSVSTNAQFIEITGNTFWQILDDTAISLGCSNAGCVVQDSLIQGNYIRQVAGDWTWGVRLDHGVHSSQVVDNVLYDMSYGGIYVGSTEYEPPNRVVGNALWSTGGPGIEVQGATVVANNLVMDAGTYGIESSNPNRDTLEGAVIVHNSVVDAGSWGVYLEDWPNRPGMVFANNAVVVPTGQAVYFRIGDEEVDTTTWAAGNVITGLVDDLAEDSYTAGAGYTDFVSVPGRDLYPSQGSLLFNAGDADEDSQVPASDFNGIPRQLELPDVGAYEWVGPENPGWSVQPGFKQPWEEVLAQQPEPEGGCGGGGGDTGDQALLLLALLPLLRRRRDS